MAETQSAMRSTDLPQHGFGTWFAFNRKSEAPLVAALPLKPGVYAVRCCQDYQRRVGRSDIPYIGSAANDEGLRKRMYQYFHSGPTQRTNKRIFALVADCTDFEVSFTETKSNPEAKMLEAVLLETYEREHGELPPENKRR
jgi:excinuclease UvrABC nuclease subunit